MKKTFKVLFSTIILAICSCSNAKNDKAIHCYTSLNKEPTQISERTVDYMINNKMSFALLSYTSTCGLCEKAQENILKYVEETSYAIYEMEVYEVTKDYLVEKHPEYFNSSITYPNLMIFNKGELTYTMLSGDLENYTSMSRKLNPQLIESHIYTSIDINALDTFDDFLLFIYASGTPSANNVALQKLISYAEQSNKIVVIIDFNRAKPALSNKILEIYGTDFQVACIYENKQIKATLRYESASGNEIDNLFNSFFNVDSIDSSR